MQIKAFFDDATWTLTYLVWDEGSKDAVVIDPVRDLDPVNWRTGSKSADALGDFIQAEGLNLKLILETHAHADHLSGAPLLKQRFNAPVGIGEHIQDVQAVFKGVFQLDDSFKTDGSQFDVLISDGDEVSAGTLRIKALHTPGHTPACVSYLIDDALFTGDALFMPDFGTGRCDFPKGSAEDLYASIHDKIYALPDETRVFVGHDYQPGGRELRYETTVGESKAKNKQLTAGTDRTQFVKWRSERDATLNLPALIFPSVQVNINAGALPADGLLRVPVNLGG
ncbi:MAG: MBL fold metallo-hydrolase [Alphaproteobacteria bacterium]|nr:MBL fold metallo-hydrolase [Alphaproteobacteria bacterium]